MLSQRAQNLKPSPTLAIAAKAKELAAQGHKVISLSVGEPDWDTFEAIKRAGIAAIESGQTKYAPAAGLPDLKSEIAKRTNRDLGTDYTPAQVTVTAGAKFVLFSAMQVLLDIDDEVLIPAPYWVSYPTMAELAGAKPVIVDPSASRLEERITPKTKALLLNSPSNPSGEVISKENLTAIADVLRKHPRIILISDDIYNRLVFDGSKLAPHILQVAPDLKDRVIVVNGASKSFSMTGWRLGWAVGPQKVIAAMNSYQSQSVSCASPFTQLAVLAGLKQCDAEVEESVRLLKARRELFVDGLNKIEGVRAQLPSGAFYVWANVQKLMGKSWTGRRLTGTRELAEALLEAEKVAVIPGIESGVEGYLRLSFALGEKDLSEAVNRIGRFVRSLT